MNLIEERLKDAYLGATQTVRPDTIRGLDEQAATITGRHRQAPSRVLYWAAPLAAATAVAVIGVVLGVGTRAPVALPAHHHRPAHHTSIAPVGSPAERFLGALSTSGKKILIINVASGDTVASVTPSDPLATFGTPATGDGVRYVVPSWEPGHCGSTTLEQFTLNSTGQPGKLTEVSSVRRSVSHLWMSQLAVSRDDSTLAFFANTCVSRFVAVNPHIGVLKLTTGRGTNWTLPDKSIEYPMSLTRNGHLLEYNVGGLGFAPSAVYLMPTNAPAGPAASVSRTLVTGAGVGSDVAIPGALITPDGAHVYFYSYPASEGANATAFKLSKVVVATSRITPIGSYRGGLPFEAFAVDPAAHWAVAALNNGSHVIMINLRTGHLKQLDPSKWPVDVGYIW